MKITFGVQCSAFVENSFSFFAKLISCEGQYENNLYFF
jgi:hypothetical protein